MEVKDIFEFYRGKPIEFYLDILNFRFLSNDQKKFLKIFEHNRRISVPAGHSTGKSNLAGGITNYWLATRPLSRVIATAPTYRQLKTIYWSEVSKTYSNSELKKLNLFNINDKVMSINHEDYKRQWFAIPITSSTPEGMQGQHGDKGDVINKIMEELGVTSIDDDATIEEVTAILRGEKQLRNFKSGDKEKLLVIVDEASGVKDIIFEVLEGTDYDKLILFGNMTKNVGYFYNSVYSNKSKFFVVRMSSYNSPFMSKQQIEDLEDMYGKDSDVIRVRLKGEAPTQNENAVFDSEIISNSFSREEEIQEYKKITLGIDVGKGSGGDSSVIYVKKGNYAFRYFKSNSIDTVELKEKIIDFCNNNNEKFIVLNIDGTGVGTGVVQELKRMRLSNVKVNDITFSSEAKNEKEYKNVRTEMYFELRKAMKNNLKIKESNSLKEELLAQLYEFDDKGRFKLVKKDKIKENLNRSPDEADALALCNYDYSKSKGLAIGRKIIGV
jgi:hypothetical protein|nr:MAG TPA: large terminase [Caudoviricetes sp.]